MHTSSIPDAKYQELNMSFDFGQHEDKLIITARVQNVSYRTELMSNPDVEFEDVKDAFLNKHFKLVSRTNEILKLRVGFLNLQFKNVENQIFDQITETITELKYKLQNQVQKNSLLEKSNQQLRADVDSLMTKVADLSQKFEHIESLNKELNQDLVDSNRKLAQNLIDQRNQQNQLNEVTLKLKDVEKSNVEMKTLICQQTKEISQCRIELAMRKAQIHETKSEVDNHSVEIDQLKKAISNRQSHHNQKPPKQSQQKNYIFSQEYKVENIHLSKQNTFAQQTISRFEEQNPGNIALVDGEVKKKGSSIRFKIENRTWQVAVGLGIRNVIIKNDYRGNRSQLGHGYFLIAGGGMGFSHSHEDINRVNTRFTFSKGDIVKIQTDQTELIFTNESQKNKVYRMQIALTEEEWKEACFCVELNSEGESVSIV